MQCQRCKEPILKSFATCVVCASGFCSICFADSLHPHNLLFFKVPFDPETENVGTLLTAMDPICRKQFQVDPKTRLTCGTCHKTHGAFVAVMCCNCPFSVYLCQMCVRNPYHSLEHNFTHVLAIVNLTYPPAPPYASLSSRPLSSQHHSVSQFPSILSLKSVSSLFPAVEYLPIIYPPSYKILFDLRQSSPSENLSPIFIQYASQKQADVWVSTPGECSFLRISHANRPLWANIIKQPTTISSISELAHRIGVEFVSRSQSYSPADRLGVLRGIRLVQADWRRLVPQTGTNIRVGILDYATRHGRLVTDIFRDVAPDSEIVQELYTTINTTEFVQALLTFRELECRVINLSLAILLPQPDHQVEARLESSVIRTMTDLGFFFVAALGNCEPRSNLHLRYPACLPSVFSVGASNLAGQPHHHFPTDHWPESHRRPDIWAPSTYLHTSFATPLVTGAISLMLEVRPHLTRAQIQSTLARNKADATILDVPFCLDFIRNLPEILIQHAVPPPLIRPAQTFQVYSLVYNGCGCAVNFFSPAELIWHEFDFRCMGHRKGMFYRRYQHSPEELPDRVQICQLADVADCRLDDLFHIARQALLAIAGRSIKWDPFKRNSRTFHDSMLIQLGLPPIAGFAGALIGSMDPQLHIPTFCDHLALIIEKKLKNLKALEDRALIYGLSLLNLPNELALDVVLNGDEDLRHILLIPDNTELRFI